MAHTWPTVTYLMKKKKKTIIWHNKLYVYCLHHLLFKIHWSINVLHYISEALSYKDVFKLSQHLMQEFICLSFDFAVNRADAFGWVLLARNRKAYLQHSLKPIGIRQRWMIQESIPYFAVYNFNLMLYAEIYGLSDWSV